MQTEFVSRLRGVDQRLFADPRPTPDEGSFQVDNTSEQYYKSPYYKLHKAEVQPIPPPAVPEPRVDLADVLPSPLIASIEKAKKIVFHAVGDTGAAKVNSFQSAAQAIANEASVADAMSRDVAHAGPTTPAFFFHLGDVVYNFGEGQYYYDQFYEPFRFYDRPIFAIPETMTAPCSERIQTFRRCRPLRRSFATSAPRVPAHPLTRAGWCARR